jgi:hypothetical protein
LCIAVLKIPFKLSDIALSNESATVPLAHEARGFGGSYDQSADILTLDLVEGDGDGDGEVASGYVADHLGKQGCQPVFVAVAVLAVLIRQTVIVSQTNWLPVVVA